MIGRCRAAIALSAVVLALLSATRDAALAQAVVETGYAACESTAKAGDEPAAFQACDAAIKSGTLTNGQLARALTYQSLADPEFAEQPFDRLDHAAALDPGFADTYAARGRLHLIRAEYDAAIQDLDHALRLDPKDAAALRDRGQAKAKLGDGNAALQDLDLALVLDPDLPDANLDRGFLYLMLGDDVHAVADLSRAAALQPEDGTIADGLGTAYLMGGDDERAIASYDRAIALDPDLTDAYRGRASLEAARGNVATALAGLDLAIRRKPAEAMNHRSKGYILFGAGSYADAANALRDALALDPSDAYGVILLDLAQRRADPSAAVDTEVRAHRLDLGQWPGPVVAFLMGRASRADLLAAAANPDARIVHERECEATFYIAEADLLAGRSDAAKAGLRRAAETCPRGFDERLAAKAELARMP